MDERGGSRVFEEARKVGLGLFLVVTGCASHAAKPVELAEQERLLLTLRAQNAAYVRQIEELQNRVFILEDRLDSRRVEAERRAAPQLPPPATVTLSPRPHAPASTEGAPVPAPAVSPPAEGSQGPDATPTADPARPAPRAQKRAAARAMRKQLAELKAEEQRREKERWGEDVAARAAGSAKTGAAPSPAARPVPATPGRPSSSVVPETSAATTGLAADDEVELPDGPTLSIETPVEYVGEAALATPRPVLRLRAAADPSPPVAPPRSRPTPPRARPLVLYQQALEALRAHDHPRALTAFRRFLALHPHHDYADNAQYWMGECFYDQGDYVRAAAEFRRVVERYPRGNKVPDAMLKLGFSLAAGGEGRAANKVLSSLVRSFPRHVAATLAAARLAEDGRAPGALPTPARPPAVAGALKVEAAFGAGLSDKGQP